MNKLIDARYGKMIFNTKDIWVGKSFENYGEFSELEVDLFRDCLKSKDVVIDVGANIGSHTIAFQRIVGDSGMVIAFEPERMNFNTLCGNVAINNLRNIYCFHNAVGDQSGAIAVPELDIEKTENFGGLSLTKELVEIRTELHKYFKRLAELKEEMHWVLNQIHATNRSRRKIVHHLKELRPEEPEHASLKALFEDGEI